MWCTIRWHSYDMQSRVLRHSRRQRYDFARCPEKIQNCRNNTNYCVQNLWWFSRRRTRRWLMKKLQSQNSWTGRQRSGWILPWTPFFDNWSNNWHHWSRSQFLIGPTNDPRSRARKPKRRSETTAFQRFQSKKKIAFAHTYVHCATDDWWNNICALVSASSEVRSGRWTVQLSWSAPFFIRFSHLFRYPFLFIWLADQITFFVTGARHLYLEHSHTIDHASLRRVVPIFIWRRIYCFW